MSWLLHFKLKALILLWLKKDTIGGEKKHRIIPFRKEDEASANDGERKQENLGGSWKPHLVVTTDGVRAKIREKHSGKHGSELSYLLNEKRISESIRAGPSPDSCNWIWKIVWAGYIWWKKQYDTISFPLKSSSLAFDSIHKNVSVLV